jgi:hypothetical protein
LLLCKIHEKDARKRICVYLNYDLVAKPAVYKSLHHDGAAVRHCRVKFTREWCFLQKNVQQIGGEKITTHHSQLEQSESQRHCAGEELEKNNPVDELIRIFCKSATMLVKK